MGKAPDAPGSQYQGIFQLGTAERAKYGADPVKGGVVAVKAASDGLESELDRPVQPWEAYLAHQQGVAGAAALIKADPNSRAADVLAPFYKDGVNVKAITGNGGTADMTAGQFVDAWKGRYDKAASGVTVPTASEGQGEGAALQPQPASRSAIWEQRFAAANAISDPVVKAGVMSSLSQQMETESRLMKMRSDEAERSAFQFVDQGGSPNDIPAENRATLGEAGMSKLYSYAETRAKGMQPKTDWSVYDQLRTMKVNDPQGLLRLSPLDVRAKLDDGAFKEFEGWREDATKGQQTAAQGPFSLDKQIDTLTERLGWTGQGNAEKRGMLARQIGMAVSAEQTAKGKALSFDERQKIVDAAAKDVATRGWFGGNTTDKAANVRAIGDIPSDFVTQARQKLPSATDQQIVDLYMQMALSGHLPTTN